ncbi:MAG: HprK-related kinase A [Methylococcaceae bacterium]|nr:HprK-related kinase A [Methylococcaceae bacterium]
MQYSVRSGPFFTHLQTSVESVAAGIERFYPGNLTVPEDGFYDFHIRIDPPPNLRRWIRPQVTFLVDGKAPFQPLPLAQAYPMFEWGLNWCISHHAHQYLILHAGVIEKNGQAVIMPAAPGAGKSTLCAALVQKGWRLLSDELALISPEDGLLTALARPVGLKNESIGILRGFAPHAEIGPVTRDTKKGIIAHMRAPIASSERVHEKAAPAWLVFPRYEAGSECILSEREKCSAFMQAAKQGFNYSLLGITGFRTLKRLVETCACFDFKYNLLENAIEGFENLPRGRGIQ